MSVITVPAFQSSPALDGGLVSAGGRIESGSFAVTSALGGWYSTPTIESDSGIRINPGLLPARVPAGVTGDLDGDADVDFTDFLFFAQSFGSQSGQPAYNSGADFDSNGIVEFQDFLVFAGAFGR